jgi:hypothetical protein
MGVIEAVARVVTDYLITNRTASGGCTKASGYTNDLRVIR